jgi:KDO2-lipid IV(A) lauroyltransferase
MLVRDHIEYYFMQGLIFVSRCLPTHWVRPILVAICKSSFYLLRKRRYIALTNLRIAFPEKNQREITKIAKKSYANLGRSIAFNLLILTGRISDEAIHESIESENWNIFKKNIESSEKRTLAITGHIGNWELIPQFIALNISNKVHVIARETSNTLIENRIISPLRRRFGVRVLYKKNVMLPMLRALKKGDLVGILIDQNLNDRIHVKAPFFNREVNCTPTPALLQIRYKADVWPVCMIHTPSNHFKFIIGDPIPWDVDQRPKEEQVIELTRRHQASIEKMIRAHPDQWFWMHNRWKIEVQ